MPINSEVKSTLRGSIGVEELVPWAIDLYGLVSVRRPRQVVAVALRCKIACVNLWGELHILAKF
jgi:hypothetical protein